MGTVRVIFSRRHHIGSWTLRAFMWSAWSHCGIIASDHVIEAVMGKGVVFTPLAEFQKKASKWTIIKIPVHNAAAVIEWARKQKGKPYDLSGVLGIALRRRWQQEDAWFCSELVAAAFAAAGTNLFRTDVWRIMPRDLYIRTYWN